MHNEIVMYRGKTQWVHIEGAQRCADERDPVAFAEKLSVVPDKQIDVPPPPGELPPPDDLLPPAEFDSEDGAPLPDKVKAKHKSLFKKKDKKEKKEKKKKEKKEKKEKKKTHEAGLVPTPTLFKTRTKPHLTICTPADTCVM